MIVRRKGQWSAVSVELDYEHALGVSCHFHAAIGTGISGLGRMLVRLSVCFELLGLNHETNITARIRPEKIGLSNRIYSRRE
jgi:hypothetical protein